MRCFLKIFLRASLALSFFCLESDLIFDLPLNLQLLSCFSLIVADPPLDILLTELNVPQLLLGVFISVVKLVLEDTFVESYLSLLLFCLQLGSHALITLSEIGCKRFRVRLKRT